MKKMHINDLNQEIDENKAEVERVLVSKRRSEKLIRTRKRDEEEQRIIDKLCKIRWEKAEQEGKVKYLSQRKWLYDFD